MGGCGHCQAEHDRARDDDAIWATLERIGFQPSCCAGVPDYEMRNLGECTISRPCLLTDDERRMALEFARAKREWFKEQVAAAQVGR